MGTQVSAKEKDAVWTYIWTLMLGKQGVKYDKRTLQTLLLLCKSFGMRVAVQTAFFVKRWEEVVQTSWVAATMGDKIATKSLTAWHLAQDLLMQSKADGEVTSVAAAATAWLRDLLLNTLCSVRPFLVPLPINNEREKVTMRKRTARNLTENKTLT